MWDTVCELGNWVYGFAVEVGDHINWPNFATGAGIAAAFAAWRRWRRSGPEELSPEEGLTRLLLYNVETACAHGDCWVSSISSGKQTRVYLSGPCKGEIMHNDGRADLELSRGQRRRIYKAAKARHKALVAEAAAIEKAKNRTKLGI